MLRWIPRPAWRLFLSLASPVMEIPTSAPRNWYANLTQLHDIRDWSRKFQRWGDGNWVAQWNTNVFHQALFGQEFNVSSPHWVKWQCFDEKLPLGRDGPGSCQKANLRRRFLQVHRQLGERAAPCLMVGFFNWYWHCLSCRSGVMGTGWHSGTPPSSTIASRTASEPVSSISQGRRERSIHRLREVMY